MTASAWLVAALDSGRAVEHCAPVSMESQTVLGGGRQAAVVASMTGLTVLVGVSFFAWRTAHEFIGDGPVSPMGVLLLGVVLLVLPIARTAYWAILKSRRAVAPAGFVSIASGIAVAIAFRPGNMYLVGFLVILGFAVPALMVIGIVAARSEGPYASL